MDTNKYKIIKNDLFNIANRVREIDRDYFIVYSYIKRRYEVHNRSQRGSTFCLSVPFCSLDYRTVELVRKSRTERKEEILKSLESDNNKFVKNELYKLEKKAEYELEKTLGGRK